MRPSALAPYLVVGFVITIVIVTGPIFQGNTHQENDEPIGSGSADVTIIDAPPIDSVSLKRGAYGSGRYILRAPPVIMDVSNVNGRPMLTYKVEATDLGFSRSEIIFLGPDTTGRQEITFPEETFAPSRVENDSYVVELRVELRASGVRTLFSKNVTVPVQG